MEKPALISCGRKLRKKNSLSNNFILFDGEIRAILGVHLGVMRVMRMEGRVGREKKKGKGVG